MEGEGWPDKSKCDLLPLVSDQSTSPFPTSSMSAHGEECPKALKKRPAFPLYSTSSSFSSQNKRGKSYKKDRTTLPWEMFSSFCLALYTMLASRVKTNILAINVTIKLLLREIFRFIFSLYMKKSDILAINVIINLPKMGIWRLIFSQYMKKSNILALLITRLSLAFIFTFKIYIKTCDMFRLSALFSQIFIFSHYMKKSNILAINVIIKLQERAIWRNILTFWSGDLKTHIQKKSVHVNTNPETRGNSTLTYRWSIKEAEEVLQSVWIQGQHH